jgi:hypothetical protein
VKAVIPAEVTPVVVILEEATLLEVVDAVKVVRAEAVAGAVTADPVDQVVVQADRAAASASIFARRKSASFVSRRWI